MGLIGMCLTAWLAASTVLSVVVGRYIALASSMQPVTVRTNHPASSCENWMTPL